MHTNNKLSAGIKVQHELLFLNGVASWLYDALPSKCLHLLCIKAAAPTNCRPTEIFEMITALNHRPGYIVRLFADTKSVQVAYDEANLLSVLHALVFSL